MTHGYLLHNLHQPQGLIRRSFCYVVMQEECQESEGSFASLRCMKLELPWTSATNARRASARALLSTMRSVRSGSAGRVRHEQEMGTALCMNSELSLGDMQ